MTSAYLNKPLRTLDQAKRDAERQKFRDEYDREMNPLFDLLRRIARQVRARTNKEMKENHG